MAAYFESGFSVREPMWHGLGTIADEYPTDWNQAREWAGLTWEPELRRLAIEGTGEWLPVTKNQAVVRPDTGRLLGVVGKDFSLVTHGQMGEIIETILGETNVKFETAGSVKDGEMVWALARLDEPYTVAGDDSEHYPFLALLNSHNGEGACKVTLTQVRVVCWNTIQMAGAEGDRHGRQFSFRHVGDPMSRIEDARHALQGLRDEAKEWQVLAADLYGMPVDDLKLNHFLSEFIPEPEADIVSDRVRGNIDRCRQVFRSMYLDGITTEAHRGTALGLVDTATEYLDHVRGYNSRETYLGRTMLRPEKLKAKAINLARRVAG